MATYDLGTATGISNNDDIAAAIKGVHDSGLSSAQIAAKLSEPTSSGDYVAPENFAYGEGVLAYAKNNPIRVLMDGTSISTFDGAPNQVLVEQLKAIYGDAQSLHIRYGGSGGSLTDPYNGWNKQPYCGTYYIRMVGDSTSSAFSLTYYGSKFEFFYSTEEDGGTFTATVDGTDYTVDCSGAQSYGNKLTVEVDLGHHEVTMNPPTSGKAYLEHLLITRGLNGIEVLDCTYGGSALQDHGTLKAATGNQIDGIAVEGTNGIDSAFNRDDVDFVIYSGSVNDSGSFNYTNYKTLLNRAVETTGDNGVPLLIQAEPAGHYAVEANDATAYASFNTAHTELVSAGANNIHVHTVDWDELTRLDDLDEYADKYYSLTSGSGSGEFTGDYIHGNADQKKIGVGAMCAAMGVPTPDLPNRDDLKEYALSTGYGADYLRDVSIYDDGAEIILSQTKWAQAMSTSEYPISVPCYESERVLDHGRLHDFIESAGTSDEYGDYVEFNNFAVSISQTSDGQRMTVTLVVRGDTTIICKNGSFYYDGYEIANSDDSPTLKWNLPDNELRIITFEFETDAYDWFTFTGKMYTGSCVTLTEGVPVVVTSGMSGQKAKTAVFPDALLIDDIEYADKFKGQVYIDSFGTRKEMIGTAKKYDFSQHAGSTGYSQTKDSWKSVAAYRCLDRDTGGLQQTSANGTLTQYSDNPMTGGVGNISSDSTVEYVFNNIEIGDSKQITLAIPTYGKTFVGLSVYFYNGSNGNIRAFDEDGVIQTSIQGYTVRTRAENINTLISLTIDTDGIGDSESDDYIGRTDPSLKIRLVSGSYVDGEGMGDAVVCYGNHVMI